MQRSGDGDDVNVDAALKVITIEFYRRQTEAGDEGSNNNKKESTTHTHNATDKLTQKFLQLPLLRVLNEFTLLSPGMLIRIKLLSQRLAKLCHAEVIKAKRAAKKLILMAKEKRRENIRKREHKENNKKTKRCCPRQLENIHKSQLVNASVEH